MSDAPGDTLTDIEKAMLDLAGDVYAYDSARDQVIYERFKISATTYHQQLNTLIDRLDALRYAPVTVNTLRRRRERLRDERRRTPADADV